MVIRRLVRAGLILPALILLLAATGFSQSYKTGTRGLSPDELAGKKQFLQRCSLCHLPPLNTPEDPDPQPFGPVLNSSRAKDQAAIDRTTRIIRTGTPRMPGFQYTLDQAKIDQIIAYLKTVE